jgi:hypothetical protein
MDFVIGDDGLCDTVDQFCHLMKYERDKIPTFLSVYGTFGNMIKILTKIEETNEDECILSKMWLGKEGYEWNKQICFHHIPTLEFVQSVDIIAKFLHISKIVELMAGTGIVGRMLSNIIPDIVVTDSNMMSETMTKIHDPMEKTFFEEYILGDKVFVDDTMYMVTWPTIYDLTQFMKLVSDKKPKVAMIVTHISSVQSKITGTSNYKMFVLPVKTLCLNDHFHKKPYYPLDTFARVVIMLRNPEFADFAIEPLMEQLQEKDLLFSEKELNKLSKQQVALVYLYEMMRTRAIPKFFVDSDIHVIDKCMKSIDKFNVIPHWLESMEWFDFWQTKKIAKKFPTNIDNMIKMREYKEIIDKISKEEECLALQHRKYLPEWIRVSDSIEVELFVWLDYSTIPKDWKCSRRLFLRKIREMTQPRRPPARLNELFTGLLMSPAMTSLFR